MLPELWAHQKEAINRALNRFALFFDPGCGKSRTSLELFNKTPLKRLVIIAPLNVCRNWPNEIRMFAPKIEETFVIAGQTVDKKIKILDSYQKATTNRALIINTEALRSKDLLPRLLADKHDCLIVDESHNFKSPNSLQTRGLLNLIEHWNPLYLYLLTGTPAPQGEIDLWSTFFMLGATDKPFFIWRKMFFNDLNERKKGQKGYFPKFVVRQSSKELFNNILRKISATAKKNLVLDLPPLLHTNVYCELSKEQRRNYDSMYEHLFAVDEEGEMLNARNVLSRTLRLQQIVAGFINDTPIKNCTRLDALEYAIEQTNGEQFLIWTIFRPTYNQIGELLESKNISHGFLTGDISAEERFKVMDRFQRGELRAIVAHPKAGGVGVNLTKASYSIHYTKGYSLTDDLQCEARNYRGGSEIHDRITRIDIIAQDTIDEKITDALRNKKSVQDFILGLKENKKNGQQGTFRENAISSNT